MKPRLLDLFCGAGGCAVGYNRAGFDVVGVDNRPQKNYPFEFHQADALEFLADNFGGFDLIHASPPCQAYSRSANNGCHRDAPRMIESVRDRLNATGLAWVIENVEGAPLNDFPLLGFHKVSICGAAFSLGVAGFDLMRHRLFESNVKIVGTQCCHRRGMTIGVYGNGTNSFHRRKFGRCITVREFREAMGIDWMTRHELSQAIPPAYTHYLGRQLLAAIENQGVLS